jgi:hypothetical protein
LAYRTIPKVSGHVFISYSHEDQAYVDRLAAQFTAHRITCWLDAQIHHGADWEKVIADKIDTCAVFVVVMSPEASRSDNVTNEIKYARGRSKRIFPLLLRGEIFMGLLYLQVEDVRDGQLPGRGFLDELLDAQLDNAPDTLDRAAERVLKLSPGPASLLAEARDFVRAASAALAPMPPPSDARVLDDDPRGSPLETLSDFARVLPIAADVADELADRLSVAAQRGCAEADARVQQLSTPTPVPVVARREEHPTPPDRPSVGRLLLVMLFASLFAISLAFFILYFPFRFAFTGPSVQDSDDIHGTLGGFSTTGLFFSGFWLLWHTRSWRSDSRSYKAQLQTFLAAEEAWASAENSRRQAEADHGDAERARLAGLAHARQAQTEVHARATELERLAADGKGLVNQLHDKYLWDRIRRIVRPAA